jgi:DNA-binding CsgD family transcriptional regulator
MTGWPGGAFLSIRISANLWTMSQVRTAEKLLAFVGDAQTVDGPAPFTTELLDRLAETMESDFATYHEFDALARTRYAWVLCSREAWDPERPEPSPSGIGLHPFDRAPGPVFMWSDELEREPRWRFEARPWTRTYEVVDCAWTSFAVNGRERGKVVLHRQGRDFTERDRRALGALRPHVAALIRNARARRRLADLTTAVDAADGDSPRGVLILGGNLRIEHASSAGRRILDAWFGETARRLPARVEDWLRSDSRLEPLQIEAGDKRLSVEAPTQHALVLVEEAVLPASLTTREREVLRRVAAGHSTSEIARDLWVTPATVSKHLEHVYRKLGVTSRTGALAAVGALRDSLALPGDDD